MTPSVDELSARLATVRGRIAAAAEGAGRRAADIQLIGVTKTHPPETASVAVAAGLTDLGENRVQELTAKQALVDGARWHLIGPLQRNKVRAIVGRHVLVHTLDRASLAEALSRRAQRQGVIQRVLVQVNVAGDPAKHGCDLDETESLVAYARDLPNLSVEGLMTIPPLAPPDADPATSSRPYFGALRDERNRLRARFPEVLHLSMGMTVDLEAAVAEGATMVRVGSALFGARAQDPWRTHEAQR